MKRGRKRTCDCGKCPLCRQRIRANNYNLRKSGRGDEQDTSIRSCRRDPRLAYTKSILDSLGKEI